MPERLIHCRTCRAMLNTDLQSDSIEIPAFMPLQEISAHVSLPIRGFYVTCPSCHRELRINTQYEGKKVSCKHCQTPFRFRPNDPAAMKKQSVYVYCPHCRDRLRMARKYVGVKVACKSCKGHLIVNDPGRVESESESSAT